MKTIQRRVPARTSRFPGMHPVLARIYAAREIGNLSELDLSLDGLIPPAALNGTEQAAGLLADAIRQERRLLIVADFDADGATSCALAVRALRAMGARNIDYLVPNRFEFGYGLTPEIVDVAYTRTPDLLITVDNGISSNAGVTAARNRGMGVIITDHHLPGAELPPADAIVNPNQPGETFPSRNLAGVGVIFYVMLALRARLRAEGWFSEGGRSEPNLAQLLDLVALGTVADVVPLDRNNRILVAQGLRRINQGQACPGILQILEVAGRRRGRLVASDLGFAVGPRLNAAGRLTDMALGIECLLTDNDTNARRLALELDRLNRERRAIEADMQAQAVRALEAMHLETGHLSAGLCLYDDSWHQGVIGILAGRIREKVHRPVVAFAAAGAGELKGSARSIPGLHIRDVLDSIAARHPGLLNRFGGHAMAAGLSLPQARLDAFKAAFAAEVAGRVTEADLRGVVFSDGELGVNDFTLELADLLSGAGPWGQGFPAPVFDGEFDVLDRRVVGDRHLKLRLRVPGGRASLDAIAFRALEHGDLPVWPRVRAAYRLDVNEYQGQRAVQLVIEHLEGAGETRRAPLESADAPQDA